MTHLVDTAENKEQKHLHSDTQNSREKPSDSSSAQAAQAINENSPKPVSLWALNPEFDPAARQKKAAA